MDVVAMVVVAVRAGFLLSTWTALLRTVEQSVEQGVVGSAGERVPCSIGCVGDREYHTDGAGGAPIGDVVCSTGREEGRMQKL